MNVLPQACARLLLLSLLCTTSLCQWSKSEWSHGGSACHLPLGTVCTCPGLQKHQSSCGERLLCAFLAVFHLPSFWGPSLATPLLFSSQFPLSRQNLHLSTGSAFLMPSHSPLCFPHP